MLQAIATADLAGQIIFLGQIPYADLVNLMRAAAVVIQPSLFEGWCTIVQDAKAIGRPLICSDLSVHREQAPDAIGFFPTNGRSLKFREKIPPDYSTGNGTFAVHSKRPEDRWRVRVFSFSERLHEDATFGQPRSLL